ncbi:MAG: hypothetical protein MUE71_04015 [Chitinophagaceae bacterium]|nr:hypothetical protein [Chitinophagaceae bacterium]
MAAGVMGQGFSNIRQKRIPVSPQPVTIDSLSIVPGSFFIAGVDAKDYFLNEVKSVLVWKNYPPADSVRITYRVFPTNFEQKTYRYRYDSIADFFKAAPAKSITGKTASVDSEKFIDFGNMSYTGSFGRSLSFGNTQDAVVNSLFNLQINGMLGDSIEVAAAITDNNIPIMPDGTTQQLNEFDQVWLRFRKRPWELNLGDIDLREQLTYFMGYYKRQQGIAFKTETRPGKNIAHKMTASGAIAKGKFFRNVFNGIEGNQGPYRLRGANNELFFVVLPNTERVFVDGVQQQRGEDQDYIINYNSAEITFTPRQLINKDKRIQVEFEYADRNYLNSLIYFGNEINVGKKWDINIGYYGNTDASNSPINISLDNNQKQFLSEIGDSINNAYYPGAVRDSFDVNKILYVLRDTLVTGVLYKAYVYSTTPDEELYTLSFSEVGINRGNYIPSFNAANGKVYQWVAPQNGVPQGSYEPVTLLVTPKRAQMGTALVRYRVTDQLTLQAEAAISRWDINRFSSKDKGNDIGSGIKLRATDIRNLHAGKKKLSLQSNIGYEYVGENFRPLERLRNIEFLRDWGLPFDAPAAGEKLPTAGVKIDDGGKQQVAYNYTGYIRTDGYKGHRHQLDHSFNWQGWQLKDALLATLINASDFNGYFLRPNISVNRRFEKLSNWEAGISFGLEHNELRQTMADTLLPISFSFRDWNAFVKSDASKPNRWSLSWFNRANQFPTGQGFVPLDEQNTYSLGWERFSSSKHQWRVVATYRDLKVKTKDLTNQQSDQSLIGRAEYQVNVLKGALTGNLLYELGAGQEQRRDFSYVEVPAGRGEYTWNDYNADGIPQLNEFEVAPFPDQAKYIRIFTPTNDFVRASYNTFNYVLNFSPRMLWRQSKEPFKQFMSRWMAQSALQTNRKGESTGEFNFNPFEGNITDTNLISLNINFSNTLSYNRFSTTWGADLTQVRNISRLLLTYGFETRELNDYILRLRKNFGKRFTTELSGKVGNNELLTPNPKFDNRNYFIKTFTAEPKLIYTNGTVFRTSFGYKYENKDGTSTAGPQTATINSLIAEAKYNVVQSSVLTGKFTFSNINFDGPTNSTVAFIMLDALQPGQNLLWNLEFTRRLANSFEISFNYEGRKAGETRTVHIGRAALKAIL